ncbi:hypothetical protein [Streptomyces gilvosporeus]|uniref:Uncharacterized protein n=1 Tax=Streptomyces gilvosporeus TaxID=553510 RepID=A0A1V0TUR6_9ACTN|nr:hypothetical protein [Streptomyces gilvosporeus]ARF56623.1 hypothetical protein B1H19_22830 [Streptomyces gilvosporeus]
MSAESLNSLVPAIGTLGRLSETFRHLPATDMSVRTVYDRQRRCDRPAVVISLHRDLDDFELWREALGIRPEAVTYQMLTTSAVLSAETEWCGTWVEVHAYGQLSETLGVAA